MQGEKNMLLLHMAEKIRTIAGTWDVYSKEKNMPLYARTSWILHMNTTAMLSSARQFLYHFSFVQGHV